MSVLEKHLFRCKKLIEQQLGWGNSEYWQNQDYERLSEAIFDKTRVTLSTTTLKRIWGKVRYDSQPGPVTLNTLAMYLGHPNWRQFIMEQGSNPDSDKLESKKLQYKTFWKFPFYNRKILLISSIIIISFGILIAFRFTKPKSYDPSQFDLSSSAPIKGVPTTVLFNYDVGASNSDSVYIQQPWFPWRKIPLTKDKGIYKEFYNYPGIYTHHLLVGEKTVRTEKVIIPTEGWTTTLTQSEEALNKNRTPIYINEAEVKQKGTLSLSLDAITKRGISLQPEIPLLSYFNVGHIEGLTNDNFLFETSIKSTFDQGSNICQASQLFIICEEDIFRVTLSIPGCAGGWGIHIPGKEIAGNQNDLKNFGADMRNWVNISCETLNNNVIIKINGKKAFEEVFTAAPSKIIGVSYHFRGSGSVKYSRLKNSKGAVVFDGGLTGDAIVL